MNTNEWFLFLRGFLRNPLRVGSVMPSSRFLAAKMVEPLKWSEVQAIAELGSGTGAITHFIQEQLTGQTKVVLFEMDKRMRNNLTAQYPDFKCYSNAYQLIKRMNENNIDQFDCILSGLPFFNFTSEMRNKLLNQITEALKPGGIFIAFQYSLQMKRQLEESFTIEKIDFVPFNFPPAFVYTCRKK